MCLFTSVTRREEVEILHYLWTFSLASIMTMKVFFFKLLEVGVASVLQVFYPFPLESRRRPAQMRDELCAGVGESLTKIHKNINI